VAFVVTAIPAFLLTKTIGKHWESLVIMGSALVIGGIVMWLVDARNAKSRGRRRRRFELFDPYLAHGGDESGAGDLDWGCQILSAVFPGTSRSMSTIAAAS